MSMDPHIVANAALEIGRLQSALNWIEREGERALDPKITGSFRVAFALHFARALPGSEEAEGLLSREAHRLSPQIVAEAIKTAQERIAELKRTIAAEMLKAE